MKLIILFLSFVFSFAVYANGDDAFAGSGSYHHGSHHDWQPNDWQDREVNCKNNRQLCRALDSAIEILNGSCSGYCPQFFNTMIDRLSRVSREIDSLDSDPVNNRIGDKAWEMSRLLCHANFTADPYTYRQVTRAANRALRKLEWLQLQAGFRHSEVGTCDHFGGH
jgi:hypothetical protein